MLLPLAAMCGQLIQSLAQILDKFDTRGRKIQLKKRAALTII
jgi:hypothetical protein